METCNLRFPVCDFRRWKFHSGKEVANGGVLRGRESRRRDGDRWIRFDSSAGPVTAVRTLHFALKVLDKIPQPDFSCFALLELRIFSVIVVLAYGVMMVMSKV